ncbi:MAG TPA: dihydrodipicolinate synthase family protein [Burkholderiales bacterium]|nr:dihydrodipicolinate synthase family protein [Burkholderiales bacterium]
MKLEFKGVFPAPPTPIAEDGRIHEKALRALLDDNISHGCGGFWMAGSTGEGPILTDEQRDAVARISAEVCKGRALCIMQVGAMSTSSAVKAARTARAAGCAAVCCLPPLFFRSSERSIIDYYKAVADAAADLPFFVYNLPQLTQVEFIPAMMEKLAREIPTLKGLKHSAPDFSQIRVFTDMGLTCFSGNGAFPLPAITMGAVGTIDAPLSIAPWHYVELFSAWEAGHMTVAQSLQDGVRKYVDLVWMYGAPADVCKTVLSARLGVDCGRSIPPVNRLTDEQRREVLRAAEALGVTTRQGRAARVEGRRANG